MKKIQITITADENTAEITCNGKTQHWTRTKYGAKLNKGEEWEDMDVSEDLINILDSISALDLMLYARSI
ncbi:MAG TPA: hypothetical protein VHA56_16225 [Mucilaginibacter sp.]|nr:hypothetical protein [Mucilaginibacter sp.]